MRNNTEFPVYTLPLFSQYSSEIIHAVSQRAGGVSQGCYETLNLGLHVGDNPGKTIKNRELFCDRIGVRLADAVCCEQVHGIKVYTVTEKDRGRGAFDLAAVIKGADALVTDSKNIPLLLFFADCAPILLYDTVHRAIGLSHAGWRGTLGDIAGETLQAMKAAYGTAAGDCIAGIGPCIGQCCYEIGTEVAEKFIARFSRLRRTPDAVSRILCQKQGKYRLSLYNANKILLAEHGVALQNITAESPCTSCNSSEFYSYRAAGGKTGRHVAVICLKNR